jgi:hypothetical protein
MRYLRWRSRQLFFRFVVGIVLVNVFGHWESVKLKQEERERERERERDEPVYPFSLM